MNDNDISISNGYVYASMRGSSNNRIIMHIYINDIIVLTLTDTALSNDSWYATGLIPISVGDKVHVFFESDGTVWESRINFVPIK